MTLSTDNKLLSTATDADVLFVQGSADITARLSIGGLLPPNSLRVSPLGHSLTLTLHAKNGAANVDILNGDVTLGSSEATGGFIVEAKQGSITLAGTIKAGKTGGGTLLEARDRIDLIKDSSILSKGNISLIASIGDDPNLTESRARLLNPNIEILGSGVVRAPAAWGTVDLQQGNIINVAPSNTVLINPGRVLIDRNEANITIQGATLISGPSAYAPQNSDNDGIQPVAFFSLAEGAHHALSGRVAKFRECLFYADREPEVTRSSHGFRLASGNLVVEVQKPTSIDLGVVIVELKGQAIAELERSPSTVVVTNVTGSNSIVVRTVSGTSFQVYPGERLVIGSHNKYVPSRRTCDVSQLLSSPAMVCEVSLPYLMLNENSFRLFGRINRHGFNSMLRTAACLQLIQGAHGAYR